MQNFKTKSLLLFIFQIHNTPFKKNNALPAHMHGCAFAHSCIIFFPIAKQKKEHNSNNLILT
jgi:hypothetical protein